MDPWDVVRLRTTASVRNVPRKSRPYGELFFLLIKKELVVVIKETVDFGPGIPVETLKACALIAFDGRREHLKVKWSHVSWFRKHVEEWVPKKS